MDYILLNEMREIMAPGSARRIKRAVKKNPGLFDAKQEFFFGPDEKAGVLKETGLDVVPKTVRKGIKKVNKVLKE